nr:hypothetical protein [Brevundimonas naejangsanensis]
MLKWSLVASAIAALFGTTASAQAWRVETDRDAFTDERRVRAVYHSRQISAAIRCNGGALDAIFAVGYIGESDATVRYRIDRGEVFSNVWSAASSRDALFAWDPGEVGRRMAAGSSMVFEHDDFAGTPHRYTVPLSGSAAAIRQVFAACDVPMTDPKTQDEEIWTRVVDEVDKIPRGELLTLQSILAGVGYEVAEDGRRSLATYQGLSKFYSTYWRGCEAGIDAGSTCRSWRSRKEWDPEYDYPKEAVDLLVEFLNEAPTKTASDED